MIKQLGTKMLDKLKWCATALLIVGFGGVAAGFHDMIFVQLMGGVLWLTASVIMRDRPLIVTNGVMTLAGVLGLLYQYFG
jgi:intracellular septation protein A